MEARVEMRAVGMRNREKLVEQLVVRRLRSLYLVQSLNPVSLV